MTERHPLRTRIGKTADWIASTPGMVLLSGISLIILAATVFVDPRLDVMAWVRPIFAMVCGFGGACGLSVIFDPTPSAQIREIVGISLILMATLRASAFIYVSIEGGGPIVLTTIPVATMTFPFLIGVAMWRRAHLPDRPCAPLGKDGM